MNLDTFLNVSSTHFSASGRDCWLPAHKSSDILFLSCTYAKNTLTLLLSCVLLSLNIQGSYEVVFFKGTYKTKTQYSQYYLIISIKLFGITLLTFKLKNSNDQER